MGDGCYNLGSKAAKSETGIIYEAPAHHEIVSWYGNGMLSLRDKGTGHLSLQYKDGRVVISGEYKELSYYEDENVVVLIHYDGSIRVADLERNILLSVKGKNRKIRVSDGYVHVGTLSKWGGMTVNASGAITGYVPDEYTWVKYHIEEQLKAQLPRLRFADVPDGAYYYDPVYWAADQGVTTGTSNTTFSPDKTCTVSEIIMFLWRAYGSEAATIANPFGDAAEKDWYHKAAVWVYEKALVDGSVFNGNQPCTRSMAMTYMWKLAGKSEAKMTGFSDVDVTSEYAKAVS